MQLEVRNTPQHGYRFTFHVSLWFLQHLLLGIYAILGFVYANEISDYLWGSIVVRTTAHILKVLCQVLLTELLVAFNQSSPTFRKPAHAPALDDGWFSPNITQQLP